MQGNPGWESAAGGRGVWRAAGNGARLGGCRRSSGDRGAGADDGNSAEASRLRTREGRKPRTPLAHSRLCSPNWEEKKEVFAKTASGVNALGVRGSQPTAGQRETGEVQTAKPAAVPEQSSGTKSLHSEFLPEPETRRARPCAHARFTLRPAPGTGTACSGFDPASGTPGLQRLSNGAGPESRCFLVFPATQRQSNLGRGANRPGNQMSRDTCVQTWPCSYYLELEKRWVPGRLSLTPLSLKFTTDKTRETLVSFPLSGINEIKKEASHFIFSSITILERDHSKHWFSSLQPSRNAVFSIIEHFWRELLLSESGAAAEASSSSMTKGKELTCLMACTQKRLEDTAKVLHHQGEQLDSISRGLDKMESDLDVADRLLTELESPSWWPFSSKLWKTPSETKPKWDTSMADSKALGKEGIVIQVPAVISQRTESQVKPGRLTVLVSGLEIYNSDSLLMHRFEREDVDDIRVHTPYEISIRQRFIGKPDITYRLISAKMPEVIPILEVQFSEKIELLEVAMMLRSTRTSSLAEKSYSVWQAASGLMDQATHCESSSGSQEGRPLQLQTSEPVISEEDTQELGQILRKLKGLALDTETELERQDEALDGITAAVDRTTLTIDKHTRRMKKLT